MKYTFEIDSRNLTAKVYVNDTQILMTDVSGSLDEIAKNLEHLGSLQLFDDTQRALLSKLVLMEIARALYYLETELPITHEVE